MDFADHTPVFFASLGWRLCPVPERNVVPLTYQLRQTSCNTGSGKRCGLRENIFCGTRAAPSLDGFSLSKLTPHRTMQDILIQEFEKNRLARVTTAKEAGLRNGVVA